MINTFLRVPIFFPRHKKLKNAFLCCFRYRFGIEIKFKMILNRCDDHHFFLLFESLPHSCIYSEGVLNCYNLLVKPMLVTI